MARYGHGQAIHQDHLMDIAQAATSARVPPSWGPENDKRYPLRTYVRDVRLWMLATDIEAARIGPAVAMRLTGGAKELVRELNPLNLSQGGAVNGALVNGTEYLLSQLQRRYGVLEQELQIYVLKELLHFQRGDGESTDEALSRLGILVNQAQDGAAIVFQPLVLGWILLTGLHYPPREWPNVLIHTGGALPETPDELQELMASVRRRGHLTGDARGHQDPAKTFEPGYPVFNKDDGQFAGITYPSTADTTWPACAFPAIEEVSTDACSEASSGHSHFDEPVSFDDLSGMAYQVAAEQLYLEYRSAKRRWRTFSQTPRRKRRFFRRGKGGKGGKGHRKGFQRNPYAITSEEPESAPCVHDLNLNITFPAFDAEPVDVFFKGSGKGKGSRRGGNPTGRDGKRLTCSICNSEEHFRAVCPKRNNSSASGSQYPPQSVRAHVAVENPYQPPSIIGSVSSNSTVSSWPTFFFEPAVQEPPEPAVGVWDLFDPIDSNVPVHEMTIEGTTQSYVIGTNSDEESTENNQTNRRQWVKKPSGTAPRFWVFVLFDKLHQLLFHSRVRLPDKESLLIDCGAIGNLCGAKWVQRCSELATAVGQGTSWQPLTQGMTLEGVGEQATRAVNEVSLPIALENGQRGVFKSAVVETGQGAELPALLGLDTMTRLGCILDTTTKRLIVPGKGGFKLSLSPGSVIHQLYSAPTGHLMLPCSSWDKVQQKGASAPNLTL